MILIIKNTHKIAYQMWVAASLRVFLVEWILGRIKKKKNFKWRKNEKWKLFGGCLVGNGRGENEGVFLLGPSKSFLIKMEIKLGKGKSYGWMTKMPMCKLHMGFYVALFFFFSFLFFFSLPIITSEKFLFSFFFFPFAFH